MASRATRQTHPAGTPTTPPRLDDVYALFGQILMQNSMKNKPTYPVVLTPYSSPTPNADPRAEEPVGIIGAGPCGLYVALILLDLGIPFKVLEARGRVGGRLYTHTFPNKIGAPFNYFDVGAMRFPDISSMRRVFHLFHYPPLNRGGLALSSALRPYIFSNKTALLSYNNVTVKQGDLRIQNEFRDTEVILDTPIPEIYVAAGAHCIRDDVIQPHALAILDDLRLGTHHGLDKLMEFDRYSARAYMTTVYKPSEEFKKLNHGLLDVSLTTDVVNWIETHESSTGSFDRAFSEMVLEAVAFGFDGKTPPQTDWYCISGGASFIAETMHKYISSKYTDAFAFNKRITRIATAKNKHGKTVGVDVSTAHDTQRFNYVISTIPLPVLRTLDLSKAGLRPMQSNALRQLNYGPAVKIGMQFLTAWWTTAKNSRGLPLDIIGGQTYSDSPLRTVVYPSYGQFEDGTGSSTVLIASYSWTEDAERLAGLITGQKDILEELVLRELARIHDVKVEFLRDQLVETFPWSWSQDPYTLGAFAFFGPGKFQNVYESLSAPAEGGRLHFAGEALSTRHAWVEGALDSAWHAVWNYLYTSGRHSLMIEFLNKWGENAEWTGKAEKPRLGREPGEDWTVRLRESVLLKHMALYEDLKHAA